MQLTIEDNTFTYLYLKSKDNHEKFGTCLTDIRCDLLYDDNDNLIGLKLFSTRDNTDISLDGIPLLENINLTTVGYVDAPRHKSTITETGKEIGTMFDGKAVIHRVKNAECHIDLCTEGIFGIEMILPSKLENKNAIMPFIISDEPLTLIKPD